MLRRPVEMFGRIENATAIAANFLFECYHSKVLVGGRAGRNGIATSGVNGVSDAPSRKRQPPNGNVSLPREFRRVAAPRFSEKITPNVCLKQRPMLESWGNLFDNTI